MTYLVRAVCTATLTPGAITQRVVDVSEPSLDALIMIAEAVSIARSRDMKPTEDQRSYSTICISIPNDDLKRMDDLVASVKASGYRRASRSWMIRMGLRLVDLPAAIEQSRKR